MCLHLAYLFPCGECQYKPTDILRCKYWTSGTPCPAHPAEEMIIVYSQICPPCTGGHSENCMTSWLQGQEPETRRILQYQGGLESEDQINYYKLRYGPEFWDSRGLFLARLSGKILEREMVRFKARTRVEREGLRRERRQREVQGVQD